MQGSQTLVAQAVRGKGHNSALWLRGLATDLYDQVPPPCMIDCVTAHPTSGWQPGVYYTDAAGGEHSSDPHLRRVGVGGCSLSQVLDSHGGLAPVLHSYLWGPLPGEAQTINRGELYAIIQVLTRICPVPGYVTTVVTDSQYCVRGWKAGQQAQMGAFNDDLWQRFFDQVERLGGEVQLVKVKSHLTLEHAVSGMILLQDLTGNTMADLLAKKAAAEAGVNEKTVESVKIGRAQQTNIIKHLVKANLTMVQLLEQQGFRQPHYRPPPQRRFRHPGVRGHLVKPTRNGKWKCSRCLSTRTSLAAYRWPKACSAVAAVQEVFPPCRSQPSGEQEQEREREPDNSELLQFDNPELDPFLDLDIELQEEDPADLPPPELLEDPESHAPAVVPPAPASTALQPSEPSSWWNRVGDIINPEHLKIGGAIVHSSHVLRIFGNGQCRIVFCQHCGGSTRGGYSPTLAGECRPGSASSMRLTNRMLAGKWPMEGMNVELGKPEQVLPAIRFQQVPAGLQVRWAHHTSGSGAGSHRPVATSAA